MDLGADAWYTFRCVKLPMISTACGARFMDVRHREVFASALAELIA